VGLYLICTSPSYRVFTGALVALPLPNVGESCRLEAEVASTRAEVAAVTNRVEMLEARLLHARRVVCHGIEESDAKATEVTDSALPSATIVVPAAGRTIDPVSSAQFSTLLAAPVSLTPSLPESALPPHDLLAAAFGPAKVRG
jgi:hypothetical protein